MKTKAPVHLTVAEAAPVEPEVFGRRTLPSVERLLQTIGTTSAPRPVVLREIREELERLRRQHATVDFETVVDGVQQRLARRACQRIQPVINATGIVLHTNLGRAPLSEEAVAALSLAGRNYNNLEFDLTTGRRGSRAGALERDLATLSGAEASTIVNNCAAALVLALRHFTAKKREVIISRGELVQIGGGFRIAEILESSGAVLREVGATNQTNLADYKKALGPETGLILKVHQSNFYQGGFVASPDTKELAALARSSGVPFIEDLGSGAVWETERAGLEHEPTPAEVLACGVDLVTFSGDKLLGGPQAGIIAGSAERVAALKREPFFRALRCDKLVLAALEATVEAHLAGRARESVPALSMLYVSVEELRRRAEAIVAGVHPFGLKPSVRIGSTEVGGGSLPRSHLPSVCIEFDTTEPSVETLAERFRSGVPPVVGFIRQEKYQLDLRTVFAEQDAVLIAAIQRAFAND